MLPRFEQIEIQKAADEFAFLDWVRETSPIQIRTNTTEYIPKYEHTVCMAALDDS
jgi:cystathionine beta-lyase family protein involved in aluminum resistance